MPQSLSNILTVIVTAILLLLMVYMIRRLFALLVRLKSPIAVLELTPPAFKDRVPEANRMLMHAMHGLGQVRNMSEKLLGIHSYYSLEIVASREKGIRYLVRVPEHKAQATTRIFNTHMSEVIIKRVADSFTNISGQNIQLIRFKQSAHYMYPLTRYERDNYHDPLGYITGSMTKLSDGELIVYQIITSARKLREAKKLRKKIIANEHLIFEYPDKSPRLLTNILGVINRLLFAVADTVSMAYHIDPHSTVRRKDIERQHKTEIAKLTRPERSLSYFELEMVDEINKKLSLPHFLVAIKAIIVSDNVKTRTEHSQSIIGGISQFNNEKFQKLSYKKYRTKFSKYFQLWQMKKVLIGNLFHPMYLSSEELASLYHFTHSEHAKTENLIKSLSKTLPAPVSLKNGTSLDVLIGDNKHHGQTTPIGLTEPERQRHMYIVGGTGNGKTTMLKYQIVQDIKNGKGLAVIDPHGDLAEEILGYIPVERIKDVIYINPDDLSRPIGVNLLELPEGISGDDLLREKDLVTESVVSILRKIFSEDNSGGHRVEYILRNTIQTALTLDNPNLFTIFRLLNDTKYRKSIVNKLENNDLKIFWKNEIGKAGDMQKVKMAAGITSKIGRFLFSASARRMLEQDKSSISFEAIMDEKKIVICNFSKGLLGEDTSMLFGITVLAKFQLAALRRASQLQSDRSTYYIYVDEFQNFATMSFVQMLSEARKYKLFLIMAEQSTQQQKDQKLVDIILANVGTVVAFRTGSPADERIILPLFKPYIEENEFSNLPSHNFYARMSAINAQEPVSGMTVLLKEQSNSEVAMQIKVYSRNRYGIIVKYNAEVEKIVAAPIDEIKPVFKNKHKTKQITA